MTEVTRKPRKKLATPRPPSADATKRPILSFRVGADLSEKLRASAEASQTSISEEIERRLTASFAKVEDAATEAVLSLIAANFKAIQGATQSSWVKDPITQVMCAKAAETIIQSFGSTIAQADDDFNIVREANRKVAEQGGIGAAVLALEGVTQSGARDLVQIGLEMVVTAVETSKARNRNAILARALRDYRPPDSALRSAKPNEVAGTDEAPGQLPPSIGDQAIFDQAVAGMPLVKADRAHPEPEAPPAPARRRPKAKA